MKKYRDIILISVAVIMVIVLAVVGYDYLSDNYEADDSSDNFPNYTISTEKAKDFRVIDKNGNSVSLSNMRGKPVVVNFWASWCPPCKAEMPDFEKAFKLFGNDVCFMMINATDGVSETVSSAKSFIGQMGYSFPVYFDTEMSAVVANSVNAFPTTLFIDRNGGLVDKKIGMIDYKTLENGIKKIIN